MPPRPVYVAYYRVSTARQGESGLGLEAQRETVTRHVRSAKGRVVAEYTDLMSGRSRRRPQLALALARAKECGGTLIVAKLDRLARDAAFLLELASGAVPLVFCDLPSLGTIDTSVGRLLLTLMAGFAEFESQRIGQRVREAYAARRARGEYVGLTGRALRAFRAWVAKRRAESERFKEGIRRKVARLRRRGYTLAAMADWLNREGVPTIKGARWTLGNLWRVLDSRD